MMIPIAIYLFSRHFCQHYRRCCDLDCMLISVLTDAPSCISRDNHLLVGNREIAIHISRGSAGSQFFTRQDGLMRLLASKMNREKEGSRAFPELTQFRIPLAGLCFIEEVISGRAISARFPRYDTYLSSRHRTTLGLEGRYVMWRIHKGAKT